MIMGFPILQDSRHNVHSANHYGHLVERWSPGIEWRVRTWGRVFGTVLSGSFDLVTKDLDASRVKLRYFGPSPIHRTMAKLTSGARHAAPSTHPPDQGRPFFSPSCKDGGFLSRFLR